MKDIFKKLLDKLKLCGEGKDTPLECENYSVEDGYCLTSKNKCKLGV